MADLRLQVKAHEARAALLTSHVQSYLYVHDGPAAWKRVLELDEVRQRLADYRQQLRQALQEERRHLDDLRHLKDFRGGLREEQAGG